MKPYFCGRKAKDWAQLGLGNINYPMSADADLEELATIRKDIVSHIDATKSNLAGFERDLEEVDKLYKEWSEDKTRRDYVAERAKYLESKNKLKKIAIIGGCFNPATKGHKELGHLLLLSGFDEIWYMPCYHSLYQKKMAGYEDRVAMLSLMVGDHPNMVVSRYEEGLSGSTYELITKLIKMFTIYSFTFVVGLDNANKVPTWDHGAELMNIIPFCVVSRTGYESKDEWFRKSPHMYLECTLPSISSTKVREMIAANDFEEIHNFVANDEVLVYAQEKHLYDTPT